MNNILRAGSFVIVTLIVLYVGFSLGSYYQEYPEQRRAVHLLIGAAVVLIGGLAFAFAR